MPQFRAKARAVDLLGKGQIADLPTAISELWKNGYDAYGDNLEAFLYMPGYQSYSKPIFVLSDDGKGMDNDDITDKWFVLGTDSKSRGDIDIKGDDTLNKKPRIKMGEKGIGRLAVAYLGPQMLMLTKKQSFPLEVVFFDWRILENYNLFLTDITIPIKSVSTTREFLNAVESLKKEFLQNFPVVKPNQKNPWIDQLDLKQEIIEDCNNLIVPEYIVEEQVNDLFKQPTKTHATRFIIFKPEQQILDLRNFTKNDETSDSKDDTSINYTVSTLVGLFNLFKSEDSPYKTKFWIYEADETGRYDLLTSKSFFTPKDFQVCDHLIEGKFDKEGEFTGDVRIYKKLVPHKFYPIKQRGNTSYGPFKIRLGYVQEQDNVSSLNDEQKRLFEEKLSLYSGLFIYRDGFRVLPYGRPDTDFLEFEERRSRNAGTAFFSKRRMFGYIEISRQENVKLNDKSSREGFINNQAFRDFKTDLIAFFKDLAKKYFATKAEFSYKDEQQEELKEKAEAAKQEHQREIEDRKDFAKKLNQFPKDVEHLKKSFKGYVAALENKSRGTIIYDEIKQLVKEVEDCKVQLSQYRITKPVRFKPTELQTKKFYDYNKFYKATTKEFDTSSEILNSIRNKLKVHELFKEFEDKSEFYKNTLSSRYQDYSIQLETVFNKIRNEFTDEKQILLDEFDDKYHAIIPAKNDAKEISRSMIVIERIFNDSQERMLNRINPYLDHLTRLNFDVNEDNLLGYYKDQFEEMKKEWSQAYELAQLGIAVEIIDHQFNTLYSQMAENIKMMQSHITQEKESQKLYKNLSNAFEHLQDNYKLLQPLYRTTGKIRKDITGLELKEYADDFFGDRFSNNNIKFSITNNGAKWTAYSYESIFKPVVINIINNAIYWLQRVDTKEIRIDAIENNLLIMNSGEQIEEYQLEDVFKLFFSNRPKGRGIGLYLAKQSLNGIGFDIEASNEPKYNKLNGACFIIKPLNL